MFASVDEKVFNEFPQIQEVQQQRSMQLLLNVIYKDGYQGIYVYRVGKLITNAKHNVKKTN